MAGGNVKGILQVFLWVGNSHEGLGALLRDLLARRVGSRVPRQDSVVGVLWKCSSLGNLGGFLDFFFA